MKAKFLFSPYRPGRLWTPDSVAVNPKGSISMAAGFAREHGIGKSMRAQLYWDAEHHMVAISFVPHDDKSAFPTFVADSGRVTIPAQRFFKLNGMDAARVAARYPFEVKTAKAVGVTDIASDSKMFVFALTALNDEHAGTSLAR
jgi:hypothetical protein